MSHADDVFIRNFLGVLGGLVVFTILAIILANLIGSSAREQALLAPKTVAERIKPIGQVRVGNPDETVAAAEPAPAAAAAPAADAGAEKSGEEVYQAACVACHATGVADAPKLGDKAGWEPRLGQGLAALVQSVIKGKNAMPPRGGNPQLSDGAIQKAVEYMLAETDVVAN